MLPEEIKKRVAYLSAHFEDKECREELRKLINNYIKQKNNANEK